MTKTIFGIPLQYYAKNKILEKVKEQVKEKKTWFHIVSLNPEIVVLSQDNEGFYKVLQSANIHILDGVGVCYFVRLNGMPYVDRITGVDLMQELVAKLEDQRLRIMFLGGKAGLAEKVAGCYKRTHPKGVYFGTQGIQNIRGADVEKEEQKVLQEVARFKPDILFVSFGSPDQELWIWRHREQLRGIVCMGVGGAFDFVAGKVPRAPSYMQKHGLEWLFRLVRQPWRWRRQLRLIRFIGLSIRAYVHKTF
jgi:N-acetylglucosaminyldiphosphoundecaprenol N-acetyl-beta-D-mannosaminyltransferase